MYAQDPSAVASANGLTCQDGAGGAERRCIFGLPGLKQVETCIWGPRSRRAVGKMKITGSQ